MTKVCFKLIKKAENFLSADPKLNLPDKRSNVSLLPSIHVLLKPALLIVPNKAHKHYNPILHY